MGLFFVAEEKVPVDLRRHKSRGTGRSRATGRLVDLRGAEIRARDMNDLAGSDELTESLERLLDGRHRVGAVLVVEVDVVGAQPLEATVAPLQDPPPQQPGRYGSPGAGERTS